MAMNMSDFEVRDLLIVTSRHKHRGEIVEERRAAIVTAVDYNGLGCITFIPAYRLASKEGILTSGSGSFKAEEVGTKPFGKIKVEIVGKGSLPMDGHWSPRPGNVGYDLMC